MSLNLYLISQEKQTGYDTYDSAVVTAESEDEARNMHPSGYKPYKPYDYGYYGKLINSICSPHHDSSWANSPDNVKVKLIGKAEDNVEKGVICSSFNAG